MMKKLFLLPAICAFGAVGANAQSVGGSAAKGQINENQRAVAQPSMISGLSDFTRPTGTVTTPSAKTTVGGKRWYSYAEYVDKLAPLTDSTTFPYMWGKGNIMGIYGAAGGGLVADTIQLASIGISFDPTFRSTPGSGAGLDGFNSIAAGYAKTDIVVRRGSAFTIDSVRLLGVYGRNIFKTAPVDTMRFAIIYGDGTAASDMPGYFFSGTAGTFPRTAFGYDTVRFNGIKYDKTTYTAKGTTKIVRDILLRNTDTSISNIKVFQVPVGLNVPASTSAAGNVVGITATFISGDTYTPYVDTAFMGSARPSNPFNFGLVRPRFFSEPASFGSLSAPGYNRYYPGYYNVGFVKFLPESASWDSLYIPSYAYTAPFTLELPDIDVLVSCSTCPTIQELSIEEKSLVIDEIKAYPNPANTELNVPFTLKVKAEAVVTISNMLGQVVATQNMGLVNAGQEVKAVFNTANLTSGIYMYTVEANGQRKSERFSVAH